MCGISGVFHYGDGAPVDAGGLSRMNDALTHRGPDGAGVHVDGPLGLAHRRLAIIDLEGGHQPLFSPDRRRVIVFNGEIYNYRELMSRLEAEGRTFLTRCDTEVILAAYEKWGDDCVDHLRGMFAFALYDTTTQRLLLARDRLGIKPLYVYDDGKMVVFGSELKAILAYPGVNVELDPLAVADYFSLLYVPAPRCIFRSVRKLLPAHVATVSRGGRIQERRYWSLVVRPDESRTAADWIGPIREALDEAVRIRLVAEVPLGAFLSGGVDSSAVVATMARLDPRPVSTHSIGFEDAAFDERAYARQVVERYGTDHHEMLVRPDALDVLDRLSWHFDEPFADSSAVPTYYVSKMAREHVTVALSGDGGDENFAGYFRRYLFERREDGLRRAIPRGLRRAVFGTLSRCYPEGAWLPRFLRAKTTLRNLSLDAPEGFFNTMALQSDAARDRLFSPGLRAAIAGHRTSDLFRDLMARSGTDDPVARASYVDIHTFMVDDILTKVDRASMAVALEARVPLIDHRFMELAATIPTRFKLDATAGKLIFKQALEDRLPRDLLHRPKKGFEIPIGAWFRNELKDVALAAVESTNGKADGLFDRGALRRVFDDHQSGLADRTHLLWAIVMFQRWAERFHP